MLIVISVFIFSGIIGNLNVIEIVWLVVHLFEDMVTRRLDSVRFGYTYHVA